MKNVYIYDPMLAFILWPGYRLVREAGFLPSKTIYMGRERVQGDDDCYRVHQMLTSEVEIAMPDRAAVMAYAFDRKGVKPQKSLDKYVSGLQKEQFESELRYFMALGKWKKLSDVDAKVYELFDALTQSKVEFCKVYFALRNRTSFNELWSSILTFFIRVVNFDPNDSNISDYYKNVINKFKMQSDKIKSAVKFVQTDNFDESTILSFLLEVR